MLLQIQGYLLLVFVLSPCEQSKVANLTERKNPHTHVYGVKEFFCLSVCLSVIKSGPGRGCSRILRTGNFPHFPGKNLVPKKRDRERRPLPDLPHLQGVMKFTTQISPLLNCS